LNFFPEKVFPDFFHPIFKVVVLGLKRKIITNYKTTHHEKI